EAGVVIADDADENTPGPERGDVARDIAGATDLGRVVTNRKDRRRRFGRDARDLSIDEIVEHDVADAEDRLPGHKPERFFVIEHARLLPARRLLSLNDSDRRDPDRTSRNASPHLRGR